MPTPLREGIGGTDKHFNSIFFWLSQERSIGSDGAACLQLLNRLKSEARSAGDGFGIAAVAVLLHTTPQVPLVVRPPPEDCGQAIRPQG